MKQLAIGILAHVDAGKTTLSEGMLWSTGMIRSHGRVDNGDAFLDTYELEKERGITIFSKQAIMNLGDTCVTLLDTPGHVDFSAEMERALQVMDYAILVISGAAGIQSHTVTLWNLLNRYQVPTFIFVNKMDQDGVDRQALMEKLKAELSTGCVDFVGPGFEKDLTPTDKSKGETATDYRKHGWYADPTWKEQWAEECACCNEEVLENFLLTEELADEDISKMIANRELFPCYFGSALHMVGIQKFLSDLEDRLLIRKWPKQFAARVFKISRDNQGARLTFLKVTGGSLKARALLSGINKNAEAEDGSDAEWEEKVNQIRIYSGDKFTPVEEAEAGTVCAVTGLSFTYAGQGLGEEQEGELPLLEPVLVYRIIPPPDCDAIQLLAKLRVIEEEEPQLHGVWNEQVKEIHVQVMGQVQTEIIERMVWDRFKVRIQFDEGRIVYKETISGAVEGIGHFEPLRHYAECHLLIEPGERGSGIQVLSNCSEDILAKNWQRLIMTHVLEREHKGVQLGAVATDLKITLVGGRAHQKHTEGGDFRQATYRAIRQGLKKAQAMGISEILEPYYSFRLEVPVGQVGRAMMDIEAMFGKMDTPDIGADTAVITGLAPVSTMRNYQKDLNAYTHGAGKLLCLNGGYRACHNPDEVLAGSWYDSELDFRNPTGSVFCAHGSGYVVPWYEVEHFMHVDTGLSGRWSDDEEYYETSYDASAYKPNNITATDEELTAIFNSIARKGPDERKSTYRKTRSYDQEKVKTYNGLSKPRKSEKEYLLVDGYNVIHAWKELAELAQIDFASARGKLADILSNYQGYKQNTVILVFDAYKVKGHQGETVKYHNIYIVYTKEAETADQYIEKTAHHLGRTDKVTVATSDGLEQVIIRGQGCFLLSARELQKEIENTSALITEDVETKSDQGKGKNYLLDHADEETAKALEQIRKGDL